MLFKIYKIPKTNLQISNLAQFYLIRKNSFMQAAIKFNSTINGLSAEILFLYIWAEMALESFFLVAVK